MRLPERVHCSTTSRNQVRAIVFINLQGGVFVKLLTGTKVPHVNAAMQAMMPTQPYTTQAGNSASAMTKQEYIDCCKAAVDSFVPPVGSPRQNSMAVERLMLVQDRSTCHPRCAIECRGGAMLPTMAAPVRSPDLMPLDFAVFGSVKEAVRRRIRHGMDWSEIAAMFVEELQLFKPAACILSYMRRLEKCEANGGGHVEQTRADSDDEAELWETSSDETENESE